MVAPQARVPRWVVETAAVAVPAVVAVLGVAPFGWSVAAALLACALLRSR